VRDMNAFARAMGLLRRDAGHEDVVAAFAET
jgi:hypothetical protein